MDLNLDNFKVGIDPEEIKKKVLDKTPDFTVRFFNTSISGKGNLLVEVKVTEGADVSEGQVINTILNLAKGFLDNDSTIKENFLSHF